MPQESEENLDVKPNDGSSTSGDAMEDSSTSKSSEHGDSASNESLATFLSKNSKEYAAKGEDEEDQLATDDGTKTSDSETELDGKKKIDEKVEEEEEVKKTSEEEEVDPEKDKVDEEGEEKGPIPYERFQEKVVEFDNLKREYESVQPKVKNYDNIVRYCEDSGITPEQYHKALEIQGLLNNDPAEALKQLLPIVNELQGFVGDRLPPDLQKEVDDATISLERAKEIASLRAKTMFGVKKTQYDQQQVLRRQQEKFQNDVRTSMATWEEGKRTNDPDYKPKAKATDLDGKWELTRDKFLAMLNEVDSQGNSVHPIKTTQDGVALLEKAYASVNDFFTKRFAATKKPTRKNITTRGGPGEKKTIETAESMADVVDIAYARNR